MAENNAVAGACCAAADVVFNEARMTILQDYIRRLDDLKADIEARGVACDAPHA